MASDSQDPFPLFHLAGLDFACNASTVPNLPSYQLALAPWSSEWDESMEAVLKRTFRRRREKVRAQIAAKAPMGVHSSARERQLEQFPNFEMIDLTFGLDNLDNLTSAQLAAVIFHPSSTKDLVMDAEDVFFRRRERDFAAGLALPAETALDHPPAALPRQAAHQSSPPPSNLLDRISARPMPPPPAPAQHVTPSRQYETDPLPFSLPGMNSVRRRTDEPARASSSLIDRDQDRRERERDTDRLRERNDRDRATARASTALDVPLPRPTDWIPTSLQDTLSTVFIRFFPPNVTEQDVLEFIDTVAPGLRPIAIKLAQQRRVINLPSSENRQGYFYAFAAFEQRPQAAEVMERGNHFKFRGSDMLCSWATDSNQSMWQWKMFPSDFVDKWHRDQVARLNGSATPAAQSLPSPLPLSSHLPSGPRSLNRPSSPTPSRTPAPAPAGTHNRQASISTEASSTVPSALNPASATRLPHHLKDLLWEMFVDNLPRDVTVRDCRDFFDDCEGLVGIAVPPQDPSSYIRHCWLAFSTKTTRQRAQNNMKGQRFPGATSKLWVEFGENRKIKGLPTSYDWLWSELSREYRNSHKDDYSRNLAVTESSPARPLALRVDDVLPRRPTDTPAVLSLGASFPPHVPASRIEGNEIYASYGSPWRPDGPSSATAPPHQHNVPEYSPHDASTLPSSASVIAAATAGIHPSRLAILAQNSGFVATTPSDTPWDTEMRMEDVRPTAADERRAVEETTKSAWGARRTRAESTASATATPNDPERPSNIAEAVPYPSHEPVYTGELAAARHSVPAESHDPPSVRPPVQEAHVEVLPTRETGTAETATAPDSLAPGPDCVADVRGSGVDASSSSSGTSQVVSLATEPSTTSSLSNDSATGAPTSAAPAVEIRQREKQESAAIHVDPRGEAQEATGDGAADTPGVEEAKEETAE
ncbi:hypothetical protein JCM11491_005892 [Sporobolomyces phaffii]